MLLVRSRDDYSAIEAIDAAAAGRRPCPQGSGTWLGTTLKFTINEARVARPGQRRHARTPDGADVRGDPARVHAAAFRRITAGGWPGSTTRTSARRCGCCTPTRCGTGRSKSCRAKWRCRGPLLAQRFTELVGEAPMRYLANWRMQLAKQMMREGTHNMQEVATRVGYESEAAFNRAFKRATGSPPATWRRGASSLSASPGGRAWPLLHSQPPVNPARRSPAITAGQRRMMFQIRPER